jgi:RHS repeat-associated protein
VDGMRDASGQMYMRNRYYDPQSARFTQEDPIGIAGGLNVYGFAGGDPVSYSDPYGLAADDCTGILDCLQAAAQGITTSLGEQGIVARSVRRAYHAVASTLDSDDVPARTALKAATRERTPPVLRAIIEYKRPGLGPQAGSTGRANVSNASVDAAAETAGKVGTALTVIAVAMAAHSVMTSKTPWREASVQAGGLAGSILLGRAGGTLGTGAGPIGMGVGSLVGAAVGGAAGQSAGGAAYDVFH